MFRMIAVGAVLAWLNALGFVDAMAAGRRPAMVPCHLAVADSVTEALSCAEVARAAQLITPLDCSVPSEPSVVQVIQAWVSIDSSSQDSAIRNPFVRTIVAKCVVGANTGDSKDREAKASAMLQLRQSLHDANTVVVSIAMAGIGKAATPDDIATMTNAAVRHPELSVMAVQVLNGSCRPEAKPAIARIREHYADLLQSTVIEAMLDRQTSRDAAALCLNGATGKEAESQ